MSIHAQSTPAILGGEPAVTANHEANNRWPLLTAEDEAAVLAVLRDGNISTHPVTRQLEADYAAFTGRRHALAHNNGTAALLAAFCALDLEPGDEVLVPSATWWASVVPLLWAGLVPVFCEGEPERLGLDPADMEAKITERTRAVVVVHLWGLPSRMTGIFEVARRHNLKIVEDASHAHGATWRGRPCGTLGDISVFSLQGDKLAPAGEGGVLLTDDDAYYERAVCLGDVMRIIELETPAQRFAATTFGIKTRMSPLNAAIARVQLKHLAERNRRRNDNLIALSRRLEALGAYHTFLAPPHIERTYFEFIVRYHEAAGGMPPNFLVRALQAEGCHVAAPRYPLLHQQPLFTEGHWKRLLRAPTRDPGWHYDPRALPRTVASSAGMLRLPSFPTAGPEILEQYATAFEKVHAHAGEIMEALGRTPTLGD